MSENPKPNPLPLGELRRLATEFNWENLLRECPDKEIVDQQTASGTIRVELEGEGIASYAELVEEVEGLNFTFLEAEIIVGAAIQRDELFRIEKTTPVLTTA